MACTTIIAKIFGDYSNFIAKQVIYLIIIVSQNYKDELHDTETTYLYYGYSST